MRLSRKKAIELCIELWTWLAETGKRKSEWPEWEKYEDIDNDCWFCEYGLQQETKRLGTKSSCDYCPIRISKEFHDCYETYYCEWECSRTIPARKKYAKLFLAQIKNLK